MTQRRGGAYRRIELAFRSRFAFDEGGKGGNRSRADFSNDNFKDHRIIENGRRAGEGLVTPGLLPYRPPVVLPGVPPTNWRVTGASDGGKRPGRNEWEVPFGEESLLFVPVSLPMREAEVGMSCKLVSPVAT